MKHGLMASFESVFHLCFIRGSEFLKSPLDRSEFRMVFNSTRLP
jgi:hypothetical protein